MVDQWRKVCWASLLGLSSEVLEDHPLAVRFGIVEFRVMGSMALISPLFAARM